MAKGGVFYAVCQGLHTPSPLTRHKRVWFCLPTNGAENGPLWALCTRVMLDFPGLRGIPHGAGASAAL